MQLDPGRVPVGELNSPCLERFSESRDRARPRLVQTDFKFVDSGLRHASYSRQVRLTHPQQFARSSDVRANDSNFFLYANYFGKKGQKILWLKYYYKFPLALGLMI